MEPGHASAPRCGTCGVEIPWRPAVHRGQTYCCGGCAQGGPCYCSYDLATVDLAPTSVRGTAGGWSLGAATRRPGPRGSAAGRSRPAPSRATTANSLVKEGPS